MERERFVKNGGRCFAGRALNQKVGDDKASTSDFLDSLALA